MQSNFSKFNNFEPNKRFFMTPEQLVKIELQGFGTGIDKVPVHIHKIIVQPNSLKRLKCH